MCKVCNQVVEKYFPSVPEEDRGGFLFVTTSFPCYDRRHIVRQIKDLAKKSKGNKDHAIGIAHQEFDEMMKRERKIWEEECLEERQKYENTSKEKEKENNITSNPSN